MRFRLLSLVLAIASTAAFATPANAAFISIDDSDPFNITLTAGDFEEGFYVNGNLLTIGLGNSASITLTDDGYSFSGTWIDLGAAGGAAVDLFFSLPGGDPTFVTSGVEMNATTNGFLGTVTGTYGGYTDPSRYFFTGLPTILQNGQTAFGGMPFLSVSFTSEAAAIPEPATLGLIGIGLAGAVRRFRRKA